MTWRAKFSLVFAFTVAMLGVGAIAILPEDMRGHLADVVLGCAPPTLDRTPGELLRHARQRLAGHPKLEFVALPLLDVIQPLYERPVPAGKLQTFGKGQREEIAVSRSADFSVNNLRSLHDAMANAKAGQIIELAPGKYRINSLISARHGGAAGAPIILRATRIDNVILEVASNEAFLIDQPYWIFENLNLIGICESDDSCEHAFHIVGQAHHVILHNNRMENFSAHIKINGYRDQWPDDGLIQHNTLHNTRIRNTEKPVTPIDIVGASRWRVEDNLITNFAKTSPKSSSFGVFMKGAGYGGRIERNVVICSLNDISQIGTRVGISFGGGETGKPYCRDHACDVEFEGGRVVNNIVAHCNDMGIDVNRSKATFVAHNTLINTAGIDVRGEGSSALLYGNHFEGLQRARKGGVIRAEFNEHGAISGYVEGADQLQLGWSQQPGSIPRHKHVTGDICQQPRPEGTLPGALQLAGSCAVP